MTRKEEQENLIYELGVLLAPIEDFGKRPHAFDETARKHLRARFHADLAQYRARVRQFCMGDPVRQYVVEWNAIKAPLTQIGNGVGNNLLEIGKAHVGFDEALQLKDLKPRIIKALVEIPIDAPSAIQDAGSPFSTYLNLRTICATVGSRIVWADPYFDWTIFHRFLSAAPEGTEVILVASAPTTGGRDATRWREFLDISRLYAQERAARYRLIDNQNFHDRWLLADIQPFHIGGSVKDLGKDPVTISRLDATPRNIEKITKLVDEGTEIFGPSTAHP